MTRGSSYSSFVQVMAILTIHTNDLLTNNKLLDGCGTQKIYGKKKKTKNFTYLWRLIALSKAIKNISISEVSEVRMWETRSRRTTTSIKIVIIIKLPSRSVVITLVEEWLVTASGSLGTGVASRCCTGDGCGVGGLYSTITGDRGVSVIERVVEG